MTFDVHQLDNFVLVGSAVTLLAILAVRISSRAGLPSLLLYLLMGVALGEDGLGIKFEDAQLAHALGFVALAVILAEGGLTTNWPDVRPSMRLGVSLATVGVAVSVSVVAVAAHYLLGIPWELAVLLGAVTSPTDAAAVFSVLRVVPLPRRLTGALEAESGLNDAPTVVLVTLISTGAVAEQSIFETAGIVVFELVVGVLIGLLVRLRRRLGDAPGGAAVLGPLPAGRDDLLLPRVRRCGRRARLRLRRRLRGRPGARQQRAPAPGRHPVVRRRGGLAGPDRAVRHARPAALARRAHAVDGRGSRWSPASSSPSSPGRCRSSSAPSSRRCRGGSWRSSPGPDCAARSRSC